LPHTILYRGHRVLVSIIVPVIGDVGKLGAVLKAARRIKKEDIEIIVIDGTIGGKAKHIARGRDIKVIYQSILRYPGKGIAMRDGYYFSEGDLIVYLDSDTEKADPNNIRELYRPILDGAADIVKAGLSRRFLEIEERVKRYIEKLYPGLASMKHPLSPYTACKRKVLTNISWEPGWGADIALLLDAHRAGFRILEVDLDLKEKSSKKQPPHRVYREQIVEIMEAILKRAREDGKIGVEEANKILKEEAGAAA